MATDEKPEASAADTSAAYRVEVIADNSGEYCGNGLTFPTVEAAEKYAVDLYSRWTLVQHYRVVTGPREQPVIISVDGITVPSFEGAN